MKPDIHNSSFKSRSEAELVDAALEKGLPFGEGIAVVLREPKMPTGFPDIVAVFADANADPFTVSRRELTQQHFRLLYHLHNSGRSKIDDVAKLLLLPRKHVAELVDDLLNAEGRIPSAFNPVSEAWFTFQEKMIEVGVKLFQSTIGGRLFSTIALSNEVIMDEAQIEAVVERASKWNVDGFYIVAQAPSYLVENPIWLGNLLILASGLKLLKKDVLVGYSNHQMLCLAASNVDFIASGTWLNVRSFDPDKFYIPEEDKKSQRAVWYYCPQALTEFKLTFLDVAQRIGILDEMKPNPNSTYASPLFSGPAPSTINWGEQNAFRHYLSCLNAQVVVAKKKDFDTTTASHADDLDKAERVLKRLKANGVLPQERDFAYIFDVNRAALTLLINARGQRLRRDWV